MFALCLLYPQKRTSAEHIGMSATAAKVFSRPCLRWVTNGLRRYPWHVHLGPDNGPMADMKGSDNQCYRKRKNRRVCAASALLGGQCSGHARRAKGYSAP